MAALTVLMASVNINAFPGIALQLDWGTPEECVLQPASSELALDCRAYSASIRGVVSSIGDVYSTRLGSKALSTSAVGC